MIKAILFDLDDTLLTNKVSSFVPRYFSLLSKHAGAYMDPDRFLRELMYCTQQMMADRDPTTTNREVFWKNFEQRTGLDPVELEHFFDGFYREQFPQLKNSTRVRPIAAPLVQSCFDRDLQVVVATNPVFPATAIEERLAWADVPITDYPYALVTTYENMHATKPHQLYYEEILSRIECPPSASLMVGDNWDHDMVPAAELGCHTYWINPNGDTPPDSAPATQHGTLDDLYHRIEAGLLDL